MVKERNDDGYKAFTDKICKTKPDGSRWCGKLYDNKPTTKVLNGFVWCYIILMAIIDVVWFILYFIPIGNNMFLVITGNAFDLLSLTIVFVACGPIALVGLIEFFDIFILFVEPIGSFVFLMIEAIPAWLVIVVVWYVMKRFGVD